MPRTFTKHFYARSVMTLDKNIRDFQQSAEVEILSIGIIVDNSSEFKFQAIVLFENRICISKNPPKIIDGVRVVPVGG